ncbi:MAG TPA: AI-2E family transporter [Rhodanobacteraceae bacterium]|jgi:predicted PurR-regulated permease PerM|nr:AI-2E family transporter [Rhodanobacteraceae bacterium]
MQREDPGGPPDDAIPRGLRIGAAFTWRLLVIAAAIVGVGLAARTLSEIVIPFLIAVIIAALLVPLSKFLQRHRWPKWLAILASMLLGAAVVVGLVLLVTDRVLTTLPRLERQVSALGDSLDTLLARHPFGITPEKINGYLSELMLWVQHNASHVAQRAASAGKHLVKVLQGIFIVIFATLFFLIDGAAIWAWVTRLFPRRARPRIDAAGRAGWHTLTEFSRIQLVVAAIDAVAIGFGAWLLGVPLATPIAAIVFFGALVPIIGSIVAGAAAVIIALLFNGLTDALIMLGIVLLVNQLEGNVLHPLITGSVVRVHPLAVVLGVTAGAVVAGIAGAFFAVPLIATANAMINAAARYPLGANDPDISGRGPANP